ncbi:hypothetical protein FOCC_FOCC016145, partial [Frankliniella occidentalis]
MEIGDSSWSPEPSPKSIDSEGSMSIEDLSNVERVDSSDSCEIEPFGKSTAFQTRSSVANHHGSERSDSDTSVAARVRKRRRVAGPGSVSDSDAPLSERLGKRKTLRGTGRRRGGVRDNSNVSAHTPESDLATQSSPRTGRPPKNKRGRPKVSAKTRKEQQQEARKRYDERNRARRVAAVLSSVSENPVAQREAVQRYSESHPDLTLETSQRYRDANPNVDGNRHLPPALRRCDFIGAFHGERLDTVQLYTLKRISLLDPHVYRCPHCTAALFEEERNRIKWCCGGDGQWRVHDDMGPLSEDFYSDAEFLKRPCMYNNLFAMCAICTKWVHARRGIRFVKIQGRCYHVSFDLDCPDRPGKRNTSALYIDDGSKRLQVAESEKLDRRVVSSIAAFLHENNPHVASFKRLALEPSVNARLVFDCAAPRITRHGQINPQNNTGEVSALLCTADEPVTRRQIVIWKVGQARYRTVDSFHPLYEALQYPLLFPGGQRGYYFDRPDATGTKRISHMKYLRCLLLSEERFSMYGTLSDTYLVDMYARVEHERLLFWQNCQERSNGIRVGPQDEVQAVVNATGATSGQMSGNGGSVGFRGLSRDSAGTGAGSSRGLAGRGRGRGRGRGSQTGTTGVAPFGDIRNDETIQGEGLDAGRIYLPHTFVGGARYFRQKYFDAMAICSRLGNPHFFLTFTANGQWKEYKESSKRGCKSGEAHVCARVFKLKLDELMRDLKSGKFFGAIAYIVHTIEFQSRGLPHAHIIFRLKNDVSLTGEFADRFIRADIPSEEEAGGRLRQLVLRHMVHGPHPAKKNVPCWDSVKDKCKKQYPKPHTETTYHDERGFYHYKRDFNNKGICTVDHQPVVISDCDIVPYNAALLLKYGTHINLELASDTLARVAVVGEGENEIEDYVTRRTVGACDAAWRTLGFDLTGRDPTVECLPVHLDGKNTVIFQRGQEAEVADSQSRLMLYFNRPEDSVFDGVTYREFYENYIMHTRRPASGRVQVYEYADGRHFVTPRQRGQLVSRLFWVSPKMGEQYYLRMLLMRFACRGYRDLLLKGGPECTTFQEACQAQGLLDDEREYIEAMQEAATFMTAVRLRSLFVTMCIIGAPAAVIWDICKGALCEDHFQRLLDMDRAEHLALLHIGRALRRNGTSLVEQGLRDVTDDDNELGRERLRYGADGQQAIVEEWEPRLSAEQREVTRQVLSAVADAEEGRPAVCGRAFFLDAPGGTGKTTVAKYLAAKLRAEQKVVLCTASSGIAAINIE